MVVGWGCGAEKGKGQHPYFVGIRLGELAPYYSSFSEQL
jgi:hypothetical protein